MRLETGILFDGGSGFFVLVWESGERPFVNAAAVGLNGKTIGNALLSNGYKAKAIGKVPELIGSTGFD